MTTGWTGIHYDGIPAGDVTVINTMQPAHRLLGEVAAQPGVSYFLSRGITAKIAGYDDLYSAPPLIPLGCNSCICAEDSSESMSHCRALACERGQAPFPAGCFPKFS